MQIKKISNWELFKENNDKIFKKHGLKPEAQSLIYWDNFMSYELTREWKPAVGTGIRSDILNAFFEAWIFLESVASDEGTPKFILKELVSNVSKKVAILARENLNGKTSDILDVKSFAPYLTEEDIKELTKSWYISLIDAIKRSKERERELKNKFR